MDPRTRLLKTTDNDIKGDITEYQGEVGSTMYAMLGTRPDLAFTIGFLARFCSNPSTTHSAAIKWALRYLQGTIDHGITYSPTKDLNNSLIRYSNSE